MSLFNLFGPGKTTALPREGTIKLPLDLSVHNVYSISKETKIFGKLLLYFFHCCFIPPEPIFIHLSLCPTSIPFSVNLSLGFKNEFYPLQHGFRSFVNSAWISRGFCVDTNKCWLRAIKSHSRTVFTLKQS